MMLFFYEEVYIGYDVTVFHAIQDALDFANIKYKTSTDSIRGRMANNVLLGGDSMMLNSIGMKNQYTYRISVKYKDKERALAEIHKRK